LLITGISVIVAIVVGAIEAIGLVAEKLALVGGVWDYGDIVAGHFGALGYLIIGILMASWLVSFVIYRAMGYHKIGSA
jgi:nickel/cobalt transporter (NiCoT) family protein